MNELHRKIIEKGIEQFKHEYNCNSIDCGQDMKTFQKLYLMALDSDDQEYFEELYFKINAKGGWGD